MEKNTILVDKGCRWERERVERTRKYLSSAIYFTLKSARSSVDVRIKVMLNETIRNDDF